MDEKELLYCSTCGYCKSSGYTSILYWKNVKSLSFEDYQKEYLDRGWSRSGMALYKPKMEMTCCPAYQIRLKAKSFQMSKDQRRVLRRMQRYLDGIFNVTSSNCETKDFTVRSYTEEGNICNAIGNDTHVHKKENESSDSIAKSLLDIAVNAIQSCFQLLQCPTASVMQTISVRSVTPWMRNKFKLSGNVAYTSNAAFSCSAVLLRHKQVDVILKGIQEVFLNLKIEEDVAYIEKSIPVALAKFLALGMQNKLQKLGFQVEAFKGHLNFHPRQDAASDSPQTHDVLHCRKSCHKRSERMPKENVIIPSEWKHVLQNHIKKPEFDPEVFALFKKYETTIHGRIADDITEESFRKSFVNSPLEFVPFAANNGFCGFGTFHQKYFIDGRLVAVSVLDILPSCLYSKYVFWDPDLAFLSLGKYTALCEIDFVKKAHVHCPTLEYYYLGYYIDSCPKMRYKAAYRPPELLCPVNYEWVPFDKAHSLIRKKPFACLSEAVCTATNDDITGEDT